MHGRCGTGRWAVFGAVVAGVGVLVVGDGGGTPGGDVGDRGDQPVDVADRGGQPRAGPDRSWHVAVGAVADGVPERGDLFGTEAEQANEVRVGAEAAVANADARPAPSWAATRAWGTALTVNVTSGRVAPPALSGPRTTGRRNGGPAALAAS